MEESPGMKFADTGSGTIITGQQPCAMRWGFLMASFERSVGCGDRTIGQAHTSAPTLYGSEVAKEVMRCLIAQVVKTDTISLKKAAERQHQRGFPWLASKLHPRQCALATAVGNRAPAGNL
jgi:hypothetical protein